MRFVRTLSLLSALCIPSAYGQEIATALDTALRDALSDGAVVGAQAFVGRGDQILLDAVYGRVRPDRDAEVDRKTLFCIGSVSKPLTSAITLAMAEDDVVDLEAPVSRYLPAFGSLPSAPSIRQLLAHRGGVYTQRRKMTESQVRWIRDFRLTLAVAVDGIAKEPLIAAPGSLFAYSGAGYCVLGRALEVAAEANIEALLQRRLAKPLRWERTTYFPSQNDENVATGADVGGAAHPATPHLMGSEHRLALVGGSVYSTAHELARFAAAMADRGGDILSEEAFGQIAKRPFPGQPYGYGWSLRLADGAETATGLRHNGSLAASRAALRVDLESGLYAVVLYSVARPGGEAEKRVAAALLPYL